MSGLLQNLLAYVPSEQRPYLFGSTHGGAATANPQMLLRSPQMRGLLEYLLHHHPNTPRSDSEDPRRFVFRAEADWLGHKLPDTKMNNLYLGPREELDPPSPAAARYGMLQTAQPDRAVLQKKPVMPALTKEEIERIKEMSRPHKYSPPEERPRDWWVQKL